MILDHKKLPNGWAYLVSIRQVKELVRESGADVRLIEFTGPGGRPPKITAGLYTGANLDARVHQGHWCYRFRFHGLPNDVLPEKRMPLATLVISDMLSFVSRPSDKPLDTTLAPEHRILFFRFSEGDLSPTFKTKKQCHLDDLMEMSPRSRWWENTTQSGPRDGLRY